jgi:MerR family transcriptional regulator/heat shock protein HspR
MPIPDSDADRFTRAVYVISVAAELAGVHPQTLRIYERKGLVDPARTGGGSRRYSDADIALLNRIQELTNEGLNLAGVKRVLDLEARVADAEKRLEQALLAADLAAETTLRQYRGELVPINQSITLYKRRK